MKQEILTAISNLDICMNVEELRGAKPRMNIAGIPYVYTGGYNMVFQLNHENIDWAFRVWHVQLPGSKNHTIKIAEYLKKINSKYFVDFVFEEQALLVDGHHLDAVRMRWLDGQLLKDYLHKHIDDSDRINEIAERFVEMCHSLRQSKISHGDLQHGNIIINENDQINLIDYDSLCIPEFEGASESIFGLKGYQHPSRFSKGKKSLSADFFSELIIYISLLALAEDRELWEKYNVVDSERLLFDHQDFLDFSNSEIYTDLLKLSPKITDLLEILEIFLAEDDYLNLKPFAFYLSDPEIVEFKVYPAILIPGLKPTVTWKVNNSIEVKLQSQIVPNQGEVEIAVDHTKIISISAKGLNKTVTQDLSVDIYPSPSIKTIEVPSIGIEIHANIHIPDFQISFSHPIFPDNLNLNSIDQTEYFKWNDKVPLFNLGYPHKSLMPKIKFNIGKLFKSLKKNFNK